MLVDVNHHQLLFEGLNAEVWNLLKDYAERFVFSGSADGRIFMSPCSIGLMKECATDSEDQKVELNGHKESIRAMTFSRSSLVSASDDCIACLWDVVEGAIIRRFHHSKGQERCNTIAPCKTSIDELSDGQKLNLLSHC